MKHLFQLTIALFLLVQTFGFSQTENTVAVTNKQETVLKTETTKVTINAKNLKRFIGKYVLAEANFELEIVQENGNMFIISPYSKDLLLQKDEITLSEMTRGVNLSLLKDDDSGLKFVQNGYETTIKRVENPSKN